AAHGILGLWTRSARSARSLRRCRATVPAMAAAVTSHEPWSTPSERNVKLLPWQYLFLPFNSRNFHDLFYPTWGGALVLLVILVILYNVRTRQLRNHPPYLELYEWLLWTGVIAFGLLLV